MLSTVSCKIVKSEFKIVYFHMSLKVATQIV